LVGGYTYSTPSGANEIVLYAAEAPVRVGNYSVVADPTAAGGSRLFNPDSGAAKLPNALASPASYFELTFTAQPGTAYRLWARAKAQNDDPYNDSFFVQFSDSVTPGGAATSRIGTTSSETINLEECSGCGLSGWGWQDNGWGIGVMGPLVYFQSAGTHTLRIQPREDGLSIDQVVLSAQTYLNTSPGSLLNDNTILARSGGGGAAAPTIASISPGAGPTSGGSMVTITGTGFAPGATVSLGGAAATSVNVASSTSITATTAAHAAGAVNVVVTNPDAQSATLTSGYTYTAPTGETLLLVDDFNNNSLDTSKWIVSDLFSGFADAALPAVERNQRMEIGPLVQNTDGSHYNGIRSSAAHDFTGAYCHVQLVQSPASTTAADAMFTIGFDVDNYYRIYVEAGTLRGQKKTGGIKASLFSVAYNSTQHKYLRMRHDVPTANVIFEAAPDNGGVPGSWVQLYSEAWDTFSIPLTSVIFEIKGGTYRPESDAPGTVIFDNFKAARP